MWELARVPDRLTIDLDATLITAHSDKDHAAGTFKGGYGFAPMLAYADQTGEALAGELRPGNASANNVVDQIAVAERAIGQIPAEHIETIEILLRGDRAGASHELLDWRREGQIALSVGYPLTETVRAAILGDPQPGAPQDRDQRSNPQPGAPVTGLTHNEDDLLGPGQVRRILDALVAWRATGEIPGDLGRRPPPSRGIDQQDRVSDMSLSSQRSGVLASPGGIMSILRCKAADARYHDRRFRYRRSIASSCCRAPAGEPGARDSTHHRRWCRRRCVDTSRTSASR